jgi:hypothetical protein
MARAMEIDMMSEGFTSLRAVVQFMLINTHIEFNVRRGGIVTAHTDTAPALRSSREGAAHADPATPHATRAAGRASGDTSERAPRGAADRAKRARDAGTAADAMPPAQRDRAGSAANPATGGRHLEHRAISRSATIGLAFAAAPDAAAYIAGLASGANDTTAVDPNGDLTLDALADGEGDSEVRDAIKRIDEHNDDASEKYNDDASKMDED